MDRRSFLLATAAMPFAGIPLEAEAATRFDNAIASAQSKGAGSIRVLVNGQLAATAGSQTQGFDIKSSTKTFGAAIAQRGGINPSTRAVDLVPGFADVPTGNPSWPGQVTFEMLLTHTSGLEKPASANPKIIFQPGSTWSYSDAGANVAAAMLTARHGDLASYFKSLTGIQIGNWRINTVCGQKTRTFGSGIIASVTTMAAYGQYMMGHLASFSHTPSFLTHTHLADPNNFPGAIHHYGHLCWNNNDGAMSGVPRDAFWSWGLGESFILVIPSKRLVVARAGKAWQNGWTGRYSVLQSVFTAFAQAA